VTDLSSIELPYPLAGRSPVANPAGREYGGGGCWKNKSREERVLQMASTECSRLCVTTRGKTAEKTPRRSRRRMGETLKKIIIDETIKINPVCLHFYLVL
jgi:hypothetical protein